MVVHWDEPAVRIMRAAEITPEQVLRLDVVRAAVADGTVHEDTLEARRLMFLRCLWRSGRLAEWRVGRGR